MRIKFFENNRCEFVEQFSNLDHEVVSKTYAFSKKEKLVDLLFDKIITKQNLCVQRLIVIEVRHAFCNKIKSMSKSMSNKFSKHRFPKNSKNIKYSLRCSSKISLFCLIKLKNKVFNTRNWLIRHLEKLHYFKVRSRSFECSHPHCDEKLRHIHYFQVHAMQIHEIEFIKKCGTTFQQPLNEVCEGLTILWWLWKVKLIDMIFVWRFDSHCSFLNLKRHFLKTTCRFKWLSCYENSI